MYQARRGLPVPAARITQNGSSGTHARSIVELSVVTSVLRPVPAGPCCARSVRPRLPRPDACIRYPAAGTARFRSVVICIRIPHDDRGEGVSRASSLRGREAHRHSGTDAVPRHRPTVSGRPATRRRLPDETGSLPDHDRTSVRNLVAACRRLDEIDAGGDPDAERPRDQEARTSPDQRVVELAGRGGSLSTRVNAPWSRSWNALARRAAASSCGDSSAMMLTRRQPRRLPDRSSRMMPLIAARNVSTAVEIASMLERGQEWIDDFGVVADREPPRTAPACSRTRGTSSIDSSPCVPRARTAPSPRTRSPRRRPWPLRGRRPWRSLVVAARSDLRCRPRIG